MLVCWTDNNASAHCAVSASFFSDPDIRHADPWQDAFQTFPGVRIRQVAVSSFGVTLVDESGSTLWAHFGAMMDYSCAQLRPEVRSPIRWDFLGAEQSHAWEIVGRVDGRIGVSTSRNCVEATAEQARFTEIVGGLNSACALDDSGRVTVVAYDPDDERANKEPVIRAPSSAPSEMTYTGLAVVGQRSYFGLRSDGAIDSISVLGGAVHSAFPSQPTYFLPYDALHGGAFLTVLQGGRIYRLRYPGESPHLDSSGSRLPERFEMPAVDVVDFCSMADVVCALNTAGELVCVDESGRPAPLAGKVDLTPAGSGQEPSVAVPE